MSGSNRRDRAVAQALRRRLDELVGRIDAIEGDLRQPLAADSEEQAIELADDESLIGLDKVLQAEIVEIRQALRRIDAGAYGRCVTCGGAIAEDRLVTMPTSPTCIRCANAQSSENDRP